MSSPKHFPTLTTSSGKPVPLQFIRMEGTVNDTFCEMSVSQTYCNTENEAIEAVYTFPLPGSAVLLGMEAVIGSKKLIGRAKEKKQATREYEDALAAGDTAIMLEQNSGIYTANLGNIAPHETATLTFRYVLLHTYDGSTLRLGFPTVIGARYGNFNSTGISPAAEPVTDMSVEHRYSFSLLIQGTLAKASLECPSHPMRYQQEEDGLRLIVDRALADRDLVILFHLQSVPAICLQTGRSPEGQIVCASLTPRKEPDETGPLAIDIVVDCSGSMSGISIEQAREALKLILDRLKPQDSFNIIRFGSDSEVLFSGGGQPADAAGLRAGRQFLQKIDADLGGTELADALDRTYAMAYGRPRNILLITDGEIYGSDKLLRHAKESRCVVFPVGVGSSPAEDILKTLAESTGGRHMMCTPNEDMAFVILRHFERITRSWEIMPHWPGNPLWVCPKGAGRVFSGDTGHFYACYEQPVQGRLTFEGSGQAGLPEAVELPDQADPDPVSSDTSPIAAVACLRHLPDVPENRRGRLAETYNLLSSWTNYLLIMERAENEKMLDLPGIRNVPQMHAHGQDGMARMKGVHMSVASVAACCLTFGAPAGFTNMFSSKKSFVQESCPEPEEAVEADNLSQEYAEKLAALDTCTYEAIERRAGLPQGLLKVIRRLIDRYRDESFILGVLLELVADRCTADLADALSVRAAAMKRSTGLSREMQETIEEKLAESISQYL